MKRWKKEHDIAKLIFKEGDVYVRKHNEEEKFFEDLEKKVSKFVEGVLAKREADKDAGCCCQKDCDKKD